MVRVALITLFVLTSCGMDAIAQGAFATLRLNRTKVYPNQPIKASITVYTSTWFTEPLRFENLVIPDAFVLPFKRTQSGIHYINGKKYAGLEFFFLIYPYDVGNYAIAPFSITAVTPPEGDYKGRAVNVLTKETNFEVMPVPDEFEGDQWFVASNVRLSDRWDKSINQLKVGDVVNRSIRIEASGTLPSLIPELSFADVDFVRIYPKSPETEDTRTTKQANGVRIEKRTYLFEKEGTFMLPEETVYYWNLYRNKSEKRTLPEVQIEVKANPDLGMVASVRDSLDNTLNTATTQEETEAGIQWTYILQITLWSGLILLNVALLIYAIRLIIQRWKNYKNSPKYLLHQTQKAVDKPEFLASFYKWWDATHRNPSIRESYDSDNLNAVENSYLNETPAGNSARKLISEAAGFDQADSDSNIPDRQRPIQ